MINLKNDVNTIKLEFKIGVLPVDIHAVDGKPTQVVMTLSSPTFDEIVSPAEVAECFVNLSKDDIVAGCEPQVVGAGTKFLVIPLNSFEKLKTMEMNRPKLTEVVDRVGISAAYLFTMKKGTNGDVLCARLADPRGTFEDPFTGSGMGAAGVYLIHNGMTDQTEINLEQGEFVGRPGFGKLFITHNNRKIEKMQLAGRATKVSDGLLFF
jgi:PhzF family phenazine biosynthesis protein